MHMLCGTRLRTAASKASMRSHLLCLQVRLNSYIRAKEDMLFGGRWMSRMSQTSMHLPTISGNEVYFPLQEFCRNHSEVVYKKALEKFHIARPKGVAHHVSLEDLDLSIDRCKGHNVGSVFPVLGTTQFVLRRSSDSNHSIDPDNNTDSDALKAFEVVDSAQIVARLFHNVEYRALISKRRVAKKVALLKSKVRTKPTVSDHMVERFGSAENAVALVCRFAKLAFDLGGPGGGNAKDIMVIDALHDIFGSQVLDRSEIGAIVDAMSRARQENSLKQGSHGASEAIQYLSFENVWQKLNGENRRLITNALANGKMASDGLVDGVKAFERSWQKLDDTQKNIAKEKLCSIALALPIRQDHRKL